jgi:hypothetical protein
MATARSPKKSSKDDSAKDSGESYARRVAEAFRLKGFAIEWPGQANSPHYEFQALKGSLRCAVRVKDLKGKAELNAVTAFGGFMDTSEGRKFQLGYFVTPKGLTKSAAAFIADNPQFRLRHITPHGRAFHQIAGFSETRAYHVGLITFKGGVGKTKLSLLLACALAHRGHNTVLVDLNRAQNLYNLVGEEGIYVQNERGPESVVSVFGREEWNIKQNKWKIGSILDARFFIYDCPQFFEKAAEREAIRHFDMVISPILLTVDSIGIGHSVLRETIAEVRAKNEHAPIEFVLNDLRKDQLGGPILAYLRAARTLFNGEHKAALLHPEKYFIPHARELERLGTDRALNPANILAMHFATDVEGRRPWLRQLMSLADHVIQMSRK